MLCSRSGRRSLLLIGDSLTRQVFYALVQELHAVGGWQPSGPTCKGHDVDKRFPCVTISCKEGGPLRICYKATFHLSKAEVPLHARTTTAA